MHNKQGVPTDISELLFCFLEQYFVYENYIELIKLSIERSSVGVQI